MKTREDYIELAEQALRRSSLYEEASVAACIVAEAQVYATLATCARETCAPQFMQDYVNLRNAVLQHLAPFVHEDDVAEIAILCDAVEEAGKAKTPSAKVLDALKECEEFIEAVNGRCQLWERVVEAIKSVEPDWVSSYDASVNLVEKMCREKHP